MIEPPSTSATAFLLDAPTGLVGTLGFELVTAAGVSVIAHTTAGITEPSTGDYAKTFTTPATEGDYLIVWDTAGSTISETLSVTWDAPTAPSFTPGAPYFTVAEFRDRYSDISEDKYTDSQIETARALAEEAFEHACQVAFVPRTATQNLAGNYTGSLILNWPHIRSITSLSQDGTAFTADQLALLDFTAGSVVRYGPRSSGYFLGAVEVVYEHGYDSPPLRVKQAVMILTREWLVQGPVSDRRTSLPTEAGGSITLAMPGVRGAVTGIPEVDATIQQYGEQSYVA